MDDRPAEEKTSASDTMTNCSYPTIIIPSGMEMRGAETIGCPKNFPVDFEDSSPFDEKTSIFRHAFFIELGTNKVYSSAERLSRLENLLCGTILLNAAIVYHLRSFADDSGRSRVIARNLYKLAINTLQPFSSNVSRNGLPMHNRDSVFFRFGVMVALNNSLYITDGKETLQELIYVTSRLYIHPSPLGFLTSWQDQDRSHPERRDRSAYSQWEDKFRMNAATMKMKSLGLLLTPYTASAA